MYTLLLKKINEKYIYVIYDLEIVKGNGQRHFIENKHNNNTHHLKLFSRLNAIIKLKFWWTFTHNRHSDVFSVNFFIHL